jgi:hypothetical protein
MRQPCSLSGHKTSAIYVILLTVWQYAMWVGGNWGAVSRVRGEMLHHGNMAEVFGSINRLPKSL